MSPQLQPRQDLAARRRFCGYTQQSLADALGITVSAVARWEQGKSSPHARYRQPLARLLQLGLGEIDLLLDPDTAALIVVHGQLAPQGLGQFASLEQVALRVDSWEPVIVPGLLQTEAYAAAVMRASDRPFTPEELSRRVRLRMRRQQALCRERAPLQLRSVIDESVLRRVTGGERVMDEQLARLASAARHANVDLRVTPLDGRVHCAGFGSFQLITSADQGPDPFLVCTDSLAGVKYQELPDEVRAHAELFAHLQQVALTPEESIDLIAAIRRCSTP